MPEPLDGNLPARLYGELLKFEFDLARHFDGGFQDCPFQREWHNLSLEFRGIMEGSYPIVTVTANQTSSREARSSTSFSEMLGTPTKTRNLATISIDSDSDIEKTWLKTAYSAKASAVFGAIDAPEGRAYRRDSSIQDKPKPEAIWT